MATNSSYNNGGFSRVPTAAELPGEEDLDLTPSEDDSVGMLRSRASKTGARINAGYDIWFSKKGESKVISTQDIITFFNNTCTEFLVCIVHKNSRYGINDDLYSTPLKKIALSQQEYTASIRMDDCFELLLVVCKDENGRRVYPQYPANNRVVISSGRGDFRIDYSADNMGAFRASLIPNIGTPQVNNREVRITKSNSLITCEVGLYKEGALVKMFVLDHAANTLKFTLPDTYAAALYSFADVNNGLARIGEFFDVVPGKIYWFTSGPNNEVLQCSSSNRNLLRVPTSTELDNIIEGLKMNPNY